MILSNTCQMRTNAPPVQWQIGEYTVTIEAATHEGHAGTDWRIQDGAGGYRAGGWERSDGEALAACLTLLEVLLRTP